MEEKGVWTSLALGGAAVALFLTLLRWSRSKGQLPPSAPSLPIIGSSLHLGKDPRKPLLALKKKLGDVFTVYFGSKPVIILSSYETIKEAFVKQGNAFAGRPQDLLIVEIITKGYGVILGEGPMWREQRKFAHGVLRGFGMGRAILQEKVHGELKPFMDFIQSVAAHPVDMANPLQTAVSNIICSTVFGKRFDYSDPKFLDFMKILYDGFRATKLGGIVDIFPWISKIPGDLFGVNKVFSKIKRLYDFYKDQIRQHKENFDTENVQDFIDSYLQEMERQKKLGNTNTSFHEKQLEIIIGDLFAAGTETTSSTLNWAIAYLLHNPHVQSKVQQEITNVVGTERLPRMSDKPELPYTEATLLEVQRMATIAPLGVVHTTVEDVHFRNYMIPCGTRVASNLHGVHHDPSEWLEPYTFDPTRFLDSDGKITNNEKVIQFSMGKRVCLGESMARMELFLFFAALLQHFTFKLPPGHPLPDLEGVFGSTLSVKPFKTEIVPNRSD